MLARMVERQIVARGVRDPRVLNAMRSVPRERFVPAALASAAYDDSPLPIGFAQTISQPYIVAFMTEALMLEPGDRVLEVGTGSGYQAAVLAELGAEVYTVEIVAALAERAEATLRALGYGDDRVRVRCGDGHRGWPEAAPFDAILVAAAAAAVPQTLVAQLRPGGRMILPVGQDQQELVMVSRDRVEPGLVTTRALLPVQFVPMTGAAHTQSEPTS